MQRETLLLATLVVAVGLAVPALAAGAPHDGEAYDGTHVSFAVEDDRIADYTVDGEVLFPSVTVAGGEPVEDASTIDDLDGSALEVTSHTGSRIDVASDEGAELYTYDNERGHLVVHAAEERTHVEVEIGETAGATTEGHLALVQGRTQTGSFVVAGEGESEVEVNEEGDIVADLAAGDRLVFRSHGAVRDAEDRASERLISQGLTAGEVYVHEREGEVVADAVEYRDDVTVEAPQGEDGFLEVAVEGVDDGSIVVVEVSEQLIDEPDDTEVRVSGTEAEQLDRYGELIDAAGERPAYVVDTPTTSDASAAYLVAVEGSQREVIAFDETASPLDVPGFGAPAALAALLVGALALARRRRA